LKFKLRRFWKIENTIITMDNEQIDDDKISICIFFDNSDIFRNWKDDMNIVWTRIKTSDS